MMAEAYWDGTRDHDVSQNHTSFLDAIENDPPYSILDLGCGPGRDLHHFRLLGQQRCRPGRIDGTRGYGTKRRWLRTRCRRPRTRDSFACRDTSELDRLLQRNQSGGFLSGVQLYKYLQSHNCIGLSAGRVRVYAIQGQYVCIYDPKDKNKTIRPCAWTRRDMLSK